MKTLLPITLITLLFSTGCAEKTGPIACWDFDQIKDGVVIDSTGNGHDGTIEGKLEVVKGVKGNALEFPGQKTDYINVTNKEGLNLSEALTIEAWVNRTDTGTRWDTIVSNGHANQGYQLFYGEDPQSLALYLNTDDKGYGGVIGSYIPMNEWMHLAVVFDSSKGKVTFYQNGEVTADKEHQGKITNHPDHFYIGLGSVFFNAFRGIMDEVKIYNRPLSAEEVTNHYHEFSKQLPPPAPVPIKSFQNLHAELEGNKTVFTFEKTEEFLKSEEGKAETTSLSIFRNLHRRNDSNPGVKTADKIFEGELKCQTDGTFKYIDTAPEKEGYSYFYWVSKDGNNFRAKPAKVRNYHDDIWWSVDKIQAESERLVEKYPDMVEMVNVGKSVEGRPFNALYVGNRDRMIALIGAVHVSESGPELILGALEHLLEEKSELLKEVGIAALPCSSLDRRDYMLRTGYTLYLRKNANGVDINRNFDVNWDTVQIFGKERSDNPKDQIYRGTAPMSEPEAQAIAKMVNESKPYALFSFHAVGSLSNGLFLGSSYANDDPELAQLCRQVGKIYAQKMYPEHWEEYYEVLLHEPQGRLSSWMTVKHRVPGFDMELDKCPGPQAVVRADAVEPEMLDDFKKRHADGIAAVLQAIIEGEVEKLE